MASSVRVTETCKITPPTDSAPATESSLPLTFFDTHWFKFHPVERIFFYQLAADPTAALSGLKHSLSLTLLHFLPFAGNLVWPENSDKPFILYTPGEGVSLTVCESDADFDSISGHDVREIPESHQYLRELRVTEKEAETMSFQITFFPNKGFCIGVSSHHAIFDGKSIILFLKAWAYMCKEIGKVDGNPTLPPELTPFLDRTVIEDPEGIDMVYVNNWIKMASFSGMDPNPKSLKLLPMPQSTTDTIFVRGTFTLSVEDVKKIRQIALSQLATKEDTNQANPKYFSTFVLAYTYVAIAITKAKGLESKKTLILGFTADFRARLNPPIHTNYFGNCVFPTFMRTQVESVIKEDALAYTANELTNLVKELEKGALDGAKEKLETFMKFDPNSMEAIGVAGSPRFEVYSVDFGWGKPKKVEVTSIDRSTSISVAETREGNGGLEIGVVLKKDEMDLFASYFRNGLKDL